METWISLFVAQSDPFGHEIDCHAVLGSYYPYRPANRFGPAEHAEVEFHLAWNPGGPPSEFLSSQCSEARWAEIADDLVTKLEQRKVA